MKEIQEQLHMKKLPNHIECFDNSNIQGSDAVAACVVFKKAKPSKKEYRKYIIKTVTGPDDYASMKEVVRRRYSRAIEEGSPLPDLIITDGGKGQMEVVREVIEDELHLDIPIAGLAKDRKHRTSELLYGFPPLTIGVKQSTPLFHLLENIQNEVHPRHHLPPGQTKQESGGVRFGQYQGNRRKKKDRPAENIQKRQPHQASLTGRDCSRGR